METKEVEEILSHICQEIGGDWLLAGGALVKIEFDSTRGTEDIDIMRLNHPTLSDEATRNLLFKWLIQRGSGPEWVNPALEPFVREADGWENQIILLREGKKGKVFRPTLTLFAFLKLRRGTDIDIRDILKAIPHCPEGFDLMTFKKWNHPTAQKNFKRVEKELLKLKR